MPIRRYNCARKIRFLKFKISSTPLKIAKNRSKGRLFALEIAYFRFVLTFLRARVIIYTLFIFMKVEMQEEDLQTEEGKALQEGENTPQHAEETQREQSETAQTSQNAEIVEPEAIEGDFVVAKPEIVYHLSDFDGPIPLLYELIKSAKIAIEDIFISEVTSQYVEIIRNTPKEELDFDYAGEFITMAAELVYLKSIRTLPKEDEEITEDDPEYERQLLINKIKEYALLVEQSDKLREIETINRFYRAPVFTDKDYRVALVNFSLPKLVDAFARVLANAAIHEQEVIPKKVVKDRFSVHEQMENIRLMISVRKQMKFTDLFEPDYDKGDIVTTFLAVLELLKYGRLRAEQEEVFGEITIYAIEGTEDVPIDFEEGDDGKY